MIQVRHVFSPCESNVLGSTIFHSNISTACLYSDGIAKHDFTTTINFEHCVYNLSGFFFSGAPNTDHSGFCASLYHLNRAKLQTSRNTILFH